MTRAIGQFTIYDLTDVIVQATAPANPTEGMVWLNTSGSAPHLFFVYQSGAWVRTDYNSLEELDSDSYQKVEDSHQKITDLDADNKITRYERSVIRGEVAAITGVFLSGSDPMPTITQIDANGIGDLYTLRHACRELGLPETDDTYVQVGTAYTALRSYLSGMSIKGWDIDTDGTVTVVSSTYDQKWKDYYYAYNALEVVKNKRAQEYADEQAKEAEEQANKWAQKLETGTANFSRSSVAYDDGGNQVAANIPRYKVVGKNLLPYMEVGGLYWASGADADLTDRLRSPFIGVKANTTYIFSISGVPVSFCWVEYNNNKEQVSYQSAAYTTITTGDSTQYVRLVYNDTVNPEQKFQMEEGSSVTPFEPFNQGVLVEEGTTNTVAGAIAKAIPPATVTNETSWSRTGGSSIKADGANSSSSYAGIGNVTLVNGVTYTASAYIKNPGATPINVTISISGGGTVTYTLNPYEVRRVKSTWTSTVDATSGSVRMYTDGGETFYFDDIQVEQKPYATSFIDGTRQAETLTLSSEVFDNEAGTVEVKAICPKHDGQVHYILGHSYGADNRFYFYMIDGKITVGLADKPSLLTASSKVFTEGEEISAAFAWENGVVRLSVGGQIYTANYNPFSFDTDVRVGSGAVGTQQLNSYISNLRISSIARTDEELTNPTWETDGHTTAYMDFEGNLQYKYYISSAEYADQTKQEAIAAVSNSEQYETTEMSNPTIIDAPVAGIVLPSFEGKHVDSWELGGRNLFEGGEMPVYTGTGENAEHMYYASIQHVLDKVSIGDDITISFDAEMVKGDSLRVYDSNWDGEVVFLPAHTFTNIGTTKTRLSFSTKIATNTDTIKKPGDTWIEFYSTYGTSDWFTISNLKIQKGIVSSPVWTPAPEDEWATNGNRIQPVLTPLFSSNQGLTLNAGFYGDGTTNDEFSWNSKGDAVKTKRWEDITLDGSLAWAYHHDYSGHKIVRLPVDNVSTTVSTSSSTATAVKYDGSLITYKDITTQTDGLWLGEWTGSNPTTELGLSVADIDSGWGETYSPTDDEVKAYFNGWKMCNGTFDTPYNGSGTKSWYPIGDTDLSRSTLSRDDTVSDPVPTDVSPSITEGTINHYQLVYQLLDPIAVDVAFDGILDVLQGENQIDISYPNNTPEIETGTFKYATNLATATQDTRYLIPKVMSRVTDVESKITEDAITNTVRNSVAYQIDLATKADAAELGNLATRDELQGITDGVDDQIADAIDAIDFSPYVTQSQLTQTATDITAKFSATGGMNLIHNSIGFSDFDFWDPDGYTLPQTTTNNELDVLGFGSGFYFPADGTQYGITQVIEVNPGQPYTLSWYLKKLTAGDSSHRFYIQIQEDDVTMLQIADNSADTTNGYEAANMTYTPETSEIRVRFISYSNCEAFLTGIMLTIGDTPLQWSLATGELYNTNIRLDVNGMRVSQFDENGDEVAYTAITPSEFAGYFDSQGNGVFEKIFYLNGEETVTKKLRATEEITMGHVKIVNYSSASRNGWAIIPNLD